MSKTEYVQSDMNEMLGLESRVPGKRMEANRKPMSRQEHLGQFMTPANIARFMCGLFSSPMPAKVRLIEAGAGRAALTTAFVRQWASQVAGSLEAHAYEYDDTVTNDLHRTLTECERAGRVSTRIFGGDFIETAATMIRLHRGPRYSHAILNPPYKKITSDSRHRQCLRAVGLETVNLYTGFLGLVIELLEPGGQVVAILPRSFCNGPYYKPFRAFMAARSAIRHIHLFESRSKAFRADDVLQENVIILLERGATQGGVTISTSTDGTFSDYRANVCAFSEIVVADDPERFIHIPTAGTGVAGATPDAFRAKLSDLGIEVSTGPVVDFRLRDWLRQMPERGTVPLLYSGHFSAAGVHWPIPTLKKPNAIKRNSDTEKWLYPNGFYA
ncbi:MAG: Eco57I restriction-modification methylase domain-containing protein, partial [Acetobacteraceae bacterium]